MDCYSTGTAGNVSHADYVEAFYTTVIFRAERFLLSVCVSKPSTDAQARELAKGGSASFAAWDVEARGENQLLLRDYTGNTRSWLMTAPRSADERTGTTLYFGSAVVATRRDSRGEPVLAPGYRALLGFHKRYSVLLLAAARRRLEAHGK